ncbi:MAG TPA: DUF3817 domain-containing protein [Pseudonocardiaceae bacterium]|jgi:hypothetical protein|nr:DUF3817 domain-containing protein [Pseudonocardiaceae bacterium]
MLRGLRIAAGVELVSLIVLFANLATVHHQNVAALVGPVHGCAYLFVLIAALRAAAPWKVRLLGVVPGVGGLLVLRALNSAAERAGSLDSNA